jgi:hypothetical protein
MAGSIYELKGSGDFTRGGTSGKGQGKAIVLRAASQDEAEALALAFFPAVIGQYLRGSVAAKEEGGGVYYVDVDYSPAVRTAAGSETGQHQAGPGTNQDIGRQYSFSTKGGTQHITHSKAVKLSVAVAGRQPSDPKCRIGDSSKGTAGCEIIAPSPEFTISLKLAQVSLGYFLKLCRFTAKTNSLPWGGFDDEEVLFVGADGQFKDSDGWNMNFGFRYSETRDIGSNSDAIGDLPVIHKAGWHYLDVRFEEKVDAASNTKVEVPYEAHVHRVYDCEDFDELKLLPGQGTP